MTTVDIGELFERSRLGGKLSLLPLLLYCPVGILLAVVRCFIGLHTFLISKLLPKTLPVRRWILRAMCVVLGVIVKTENPEKRSKSAKIIVSNHISPLDHLAINLVLPNIIPCVWDIPDGLAWAMGFTEMGVRQGREVLLRNVTKHCQDHSNLPVLSHPEGASTSGKVGLLKFSTWPFMLDLPVQPLALQISRFPLFQIAVSPLGSTWWTDLLWIFFLPYTVITVKYLPVLVKGEEESVEDFTKRGQECIAKELGLVTTSHSDADKVEYAKRILFERTQNQGRTKTDTSGSNPSTSSSSEHFVLADLETRRMAKQVKDVLPHVPSTAIFTDLAKTKSVDATITNIVEGRVEYTPIEPGQAAADQDNTGPVITRFAADSFGKSSSARQLSFQERKEAMIANARKKFLKKHALL